MIIGATDSSGSRMHRLLAACLVALVGSLLSGIATGADDIQQRTIRFGHLNNPDHPISAGVKKFAEIVATKSWGKIRVKEYTSNQLGTEQQQTQALRGGTQEMQSPATSSLVGLVKELGVFDFPFMINTYAQGFALADGPLGDALKAKLPEKGLIALAFWDLGFRNVTNSKRPITRLEDFQGLKLRVIPNPVAQESFKALKAYPMPLSFRDLYPALEIRAVDGQENPFNVIRSNKFYKVQKYVSATNHVYASNIVLVSKVFWDTLSPAERRILQEAALEARDYQRAVSLAAAQEAVNALKATGMKYNDVSPEEQDRMHWAVQGVIDKFISSYDPHIRNLYRTEVARVLEIK